MKRALWMLRNEGQQLRRRLRRWARLPQAWRWFWRTYDQFSAMAPPEKQPTLQHLQPHLLDATATTYIEPTYFYQNNWAFEKIVQRRPAAHVDVASHYLFVAFLSKVVPVTMIDIRPLSLPMASIHFKEGTILDMPYADNSVDSLSSLCVVEHIGLGRYGDPLDPDGSEKAIAELKRVLAPGGRLYISVPVSDENIVAFNAGRIFQLDYLRSLFAPLEILEEYFIVGDSYQPDYAPRPRFGTTGLFELTKGSP